jgi:hypothetical protein
LDLHGWLAKISPGVGCEAVYAGCSGTRLEPALMIII